MSNFHLLLSNILYCRTWFVVKHLLLPNNIFVVKLLLVIMQEVGADCERRAGGKKRTGATGKPEADRASLLNWYGA
jgi:hypothetical protein